MSDLQRILVIDDDRAICKSLELLLRKSGYAVMLAHNEREAQLAIDNNSFHLILLDMNFSVETSGREGIRVLQHIIKRHPKLPVILMTGWATLQLAVEGMKAGAKDFITKPWDNKHLITSIQTLIDIENYSNTAVTEEHHIIGQSVAFKEVLETVNKVAHTEATVLITGESGTGKELIAEVIHGKSKRSANSFVKVNLGGISTSLFESEMFGHKKGAYTDAISDRIGRFTLADGGTIFLDEIGELPVESQVKLLRVLQERTYEMLGESKARKADIRVISATNKDLAKLITNRKFREDLYYRINLITIHLPPLRDRREDIPLLVSYFLQTTKMLYGIDPPLISDDAMLWLSRQEYPGNIRQLKNLIERTSLLFYEKKELDPKHFQKCMEQLAQPSNKNDLPKVGSMSLEEMEISMIKKALDYHHHSISAAAQSLGLTRSSLYRRLDKYSIPYEPKI